MDPLTGRRAWHAGVDIKAQPGESVLAARDGVVSFAGRHPELGNLIIVDHGEGLRSFYGHNQTMRVSAGQQVGAGTEIAQAGASGRAAGPHVHFEVRRGELAINPEPLLRPQDSLVTEAR
jgi:murein DD-endopeptidase MepM/ murein hydrolase activator NlpD